MEEPQGLDLLDKQVIRITLFLQESGLIIVD